MKQAKLDMFVPLHINHHFDSLNEHRQTIMVSNLPNGMPVKVYRGEFTGNLIVMFGSSPDVYEVRLHQIIDAMLEIKKVVDDDAS